MESPSQLLVMGKESPRSSWCGSGLSEPFFFISLATCLLPQKMRGVRARTFDPKMLTSSRYSHLVASKGVEGRGLITASHKSGNGSKAHIGIGN